MPVASRDENTEREKLEAASRLTWDDVAHRLLNAAQEQDASRFLQMRLDESGPQAEEAIEKVYEAIKNDVVKLAKDSFGNYVVQKLFEKGSKEKRDALVAGMRNEMLNLSNHRCGCRVVQKALQFGSEDIQFRIAEELKKGVLVCIENMHGNHVIQKCVEHLPAESLSFITEVVAERLEFIATHMYGCRIFQRMLERCPHQELVPILEDIPRILPKLAKDKHGNYVVQCILDHGRIEDQRRIIEVIGNNILEFSRNKISSNVVEKCFKIETPEVYEDQRSLLTAILGERGDPDAPLRSIMLDKFGNYIVQSIIKSSGKFNEEDRRRLRDSIEDCESTLRDSNTGKHILGVLSKEFGS